VAFGRILFSGLLTTTAPTPVYTTPPSGTTVTIAHGTICNVSGSAVTVSMGLLKAGDTVDGTHNAIFGYSLAAGDTLSLKDYLGGAVLTAEESVWVTAGTANAVAVVLSGLLS
jgi:hypothetical protein